MLQELKKLVVSGSMMSDHNLLSSGGFLNVYHIHSSVCNVYFNFGNKVTNCNDIFKVKFS